MKYSDNQKKALAVHLRNKFMKEGYEGYEIVVALMAMVKAESIVLEDVRPILTTVHFGNQEGVLKSLRKAYEIIDDEMINEILKQTNEELIK